nr:histidine kinase [Chelatococcus composti]
MFRFLFIIGVIVGAVYAGMWALATFVEPQERDITVTIPNARLGK